MSSSPLLRALAALALLGLLGGTALAVPPDYLIVNLGVIDPGDDGSQANAVSLLGEATGRCLGVSNQAFVWSEGTGMVPLPNLPTHPFGVGNGVNDLGAVVGTCTATPFGSDPRPVLWLEGVAVAVTLPAGQTLGRAEDINNLGRIAGSVGGGSSQYAAVLGDGGPYVVTTTTETGCYANVLYAINDLGLAAGTGLDPNNAARNVGFVYDTETDTAWEVGALEGLNGALCFGISDGGHVVGSSMLNQGSGLPFIWTGTDGIQPVPLPDGTAQGSARGVNLDGWVVGIASNAYAIPFLFDGEATYQVQDLLPPLSEWDLSTNTFSSALDISDEGIVVGTGVYLGDIRAYALIPDDVVPVLLQDFAAEGRDDGIELWWSLGGIGDQLPVELLRAEAAEGPWQPVAAPVQRTGRGSVVLDTATEVGRTYHYRLRTSDAHGEPLELGRVTGQRAALNRASVVLSRPAPNPTNAGTSFHYRLAVPQEVTVSVVDLRGRLVRTLVQGSVAGGETMLSWDGRGGDGRPVPAGVYFLRLQTPQVVRAQRVVVTR
jgi:uncharacterized membrane protein